MISRRAALILSLASALTFSPALPLTAEQEQPAQSQANLATIDTLCAEYSVDSGTCTKIKTTYDSKQNYASLFDQERASLSGLDVVIAVIQTLGKPNVRHEYEIELFKQVYVTISAVPVSTGALASPSLELKYRQNSTKDILIASSTQRTVDPHTLRLGADQILTDEKYQTASANNPAIREQWNQGFAVAYALATDARKMVEGINNGWKQKPWKTKPIDETYKQGFAFSENALPYQEMPGDGLTVLHRIGPGTGGFVFFATSSCEPCDRVGQYMIEEKVAGYESESAGVTRVTCDITPCAFYQGKIITGFASSLGQNSLHDLIKTMYQLKR